MHGMMLPSGNDAAQTLALYFGAYLYTNGKIDPNQYLHEVKPDVVEKRVQEVLALRAKEREEEAEKK